MLVNPYDLDGTGNAIARALTMRREERIARWRSMFDIVKENSVSKWADTFIAQLEEPRLRRPARIFSRN